MEDQETKVLGENRHIIRQKDKIQIRKNMVNYLELIKQGRELCF